MRENMEKHHLVPFNQPSYKQTADFYIGSNVKIFCTDLWKPFFVFVFQSPLDQLQYWEFFCIV